MTLNILTKLKIKAFLAPVSVITLGAGRTFVFKEVDEN